jgi:hypothetical protein
MNQHALRVSLFIVLLTSSSFAAGSPPLAVGAAQRSGTPGTTDWQFAATEHFEVAFMPATADEVERIGAAAEGAYQHVSAQLMHELSLRPLLVLFSTRSDRQRALATGIIPIAEEHILWAVDIPTQDLVHEMTHAFAFDIVPRRDLPGWLHEGLADFTRGTWGDEDAQLVREMLRMNTPPRLSTMSSPPSLGAPRVTTVVGHLAFDFLVARVGEESLKRLLLSLRESVANPFDVYLAATGLSAAEFEKEFERYVRTRFTV